MKPKVSTVSKWKPKTPAHIIRLRWMLKHNKFANDRRERERAEALIAEYEGKAY